LATAGTWCAGACTFPGHLRAQYPMLFSFDLCLDLVLDVLAWLTPIAPTVMEAMFAQPTKVLKES
jgi:hypothetical protein